MAMALTAKVWVARVLCSTPVGQLISLLGRNVVRSDSSSIRVASPFVKPSTKAALFWGFYESAERRFVTRYLRRDLDVVELGGSIGVVSSLIASRLEGHARLISVEANPGLIDVLSSNVR